MLRRTLSLVLMIVVLSSCSISQPASTIQGGSVAQSAGQVAMVAQPAAAQLVSQVESAAATKVPTQVKPQITTRVPKPTAIPEKPSSAAQSRASSGRVGPDTFPEGVSPLTGLPVKNAENLSLSPALVSVTNFPTTARPQAGLSFSPYVFEMYIGEGMTRFLAVFHGDYPEKGEQNGIALSDDRIGPVRSGRLPFESVRQLYSGFLVMSSASSVVLPSLGGYTNVFGSDNSDINSALIPATKLEEIAAKNPKRLQPDALSGQVFDTTAPANGQPGKMLWIPFSFLNQVIWRYDAPSGSYHRYQDNADGKTFIQATDRLNGDPLTYENVVILFADHQAKRETLIEIDLQYINRKPALLFRDGQMYKIYWTTANSDYEKRTGLVRPIRFIDAQGQPFPLKPGQTWVEIVQDPTAYNETMDSENYFDLKTKKEPGSGNWAVHFYPTIPERP